MFTIETLSLSLFHPQEGSDVVFSRVPLWSHSLVGESLAEQSCGFCHPSFPSTPKRQHGRVHLGWQSSEPICLIELSQESIILDDWDWVYCNYNEDILDLSLKVNDRNLDMGGKAEVE